MFLYLSQMVVSETQKYKYVQKFNYPIIYNLAVLKFFINPKVAKCFCIL